MTQGKIRLFFRVFFLDRKPNSRYHSCKAKIEVEMLGFDIGGTKCAVVAGIEEGGSLKICAKKVVATDHKIGAQKMLDLLCSEAERLGGDFSSVGVSCGGPLDSKKGIVCSPPNLPGWDNVKVVEILQRRYGAKVALQNDANACALAEWKYGAGKGSQSMVFLTCGSGMGAGLILGGRLYEGANGNAGEVGHIRIASHGPVGFGKAGSFEGFCSGNGLARLGKIFAEEQFQTGKSVSFCKGFEGLSEISGKSVAEAAKAGNSDALSVMEVFAKKLGETLAVIVDILNPERIVIGSVYQRCEKMIFPAMMSAIRREALPSSVAALSVLPAALGDEIGDFAALSVAKMAEEG